MKIAFLFSGQLRELEYELFRKSLLNLTKDLDYAIFAYSWEEMGESLNHKNNLPEISSIENSCSDNSCSEIYVDESCCAKLV